MKPVVSIFDPISGKCVISCRSRHELIRGHQSVLESRRGTYLKCGCRDDIVLKLVIAELADGRLATRAWPNERDDHVPLCPAVGDDDGLPGGGGDFAQSDVHSMLENIFSEAYSGQVYDRDAEWIDFLDRLKTDVWVSLRNSYADVCVGVGVFDNIHHQEAASPPKLDVILLSRNSSGEIKKSIQAWPLQPGISVRCRKDRLGRSLPGLHMVLGLWRTNGPLRHLHFWPIAEKSRKIHALHSRFEERVLERLEQLAPNALKVPSIGFLANWQGEGRTIFHRLASEKIWPDFITLSDDGTPTVVEAAGLTDADYCLRLIEKISLFRRWESELGLQWFVVRPSSNGELKIAHRSVRLDIAAAFESAKRAA